MHYDSDRKVAELVADGDLATIDPTTGRPTPMPGQRRPPKTIDLAKIEPYEIKKNSGQGIDHIYIYDPRTNEWECRWNYGVTEPLALKPRDFKSRGARENDLLAPKPREEVTDEDGTEPDHYVSELTDMTLQKLLGESRYKNPIIDEIIRQYPPLYGEADKERLAQKLAQMMRGFGRIPMAGQADGILACALSIQQRRGTTLVGEMGCGKTTMSIMTARLTGMRLIEVVVPVQLTRKWRREILQTIPRASAFIIENIRPVTGVRSTPTQMDLETFRRFVDRRKMAGLLTPERPIYAIFPSTMASLSYAGESTEFSRSIYRNEKSVYPTRALDHAGNSIVIEQPRLEKIQKKIVTRDAYGREVNSRYVSARGQACVDCFTLIKDRDGVPYESSEKFWDLRIKCPKCDAPLWSARKLSKDKEMYIPVIAARERKERAEKPVSEWTGPREQRWSGKARYALGDFVSKKMKNFFDLMVADEVHEYKGEGAARGIVVGNMSHAAKKTLTLTGTLMGGYSSNLFFLLQRFSDQIIDEFGYGDEKRWVQRYGFEQTIKKREDATRYNTHSRGFKSSSTREKPGLSPLALPLILGNAVFIRLQDVISDLPPYRESVRLIPLDDTNLNGGTTQRSAYQTLQDEFKSAIAKSMMAGSHKMLASYMHSLLAYPDNPVVEESAFDAEGERIAHAPALDEDFTYPKEAELVKIALEQKKLGLHTMVLINYTNRRDIAPRLKDILEKKGLRVAILRSSVKPKDRESRIEKWVREGVDVLLSHPNLIQTGLDLIDFPTIVWYQPTYSTYTLRQASRRSWRIGQKRPVDVIHLIYRETMQEQALNLIAKKAQTSLAVEGELPEEGLAAYGDDQDSIHLALAKSLVSVESQRPSGEHELERSLSAAADKDSLDALHIVSEAWMAIISFRPPKPVETKPTEKPELTPADIAMLSELDGDLSTEEKPSLFSALLG